MAQAHQFLNEHPHDYDILGAFVTSKRPLILALLRDMIIF